MFWSATVPCLSKQQRATNEPRHPSASSSPSPHPSPGIRSPSDPITCTLNTFHKVSPSPEPRDAPSTTHFEEHSSPPSSSVPSIVHHPPARPYCFTLYIFEYDHRLQHDTPSGTQFEDLVHAFLLCHLCSL